MFCHVFESQRGLNISILVWLPILSCRWKHRVANDVLNLCTFIAVVRVPFVRLLLPVTICLLISPFLPTHPPLYCILWPRVPRPISNLLRFSCRSSNMSQRSLLRTSPRFVVFHLFNFHTLIHCVMPSRTYLLSAITVISLKFTQLTEKYQ